MKQKQNLLIDILIGIVIFLIVLVSYETNFSFLEILELKLYDIRLKIHSSHIPSDKIVLVTIDDMSITNIGRWPWPRAIIAELINKIQEGNPKVIGLNILFSEPDNNQGIQEVRALKGKFTLLWAQLKNKIPKKYFEQLTEFLNDINNSETQLDNDTILTESIKNAGNIILPMFFVIGKPLVESQEEIPEILKANTLNNVLFKKKNFIEGYSPVLPYTLFAEVADSIGHSNTITDKDGVLRKELLYIYYRGKFYPSFSLQIVKKYSNLTLNDFKYSDDALTFHNGKIPLNKDNTMFIDFAGKVNTYKYFSVFDVLTDKIPKEVFKDKIVIIGHMASGIASLNVVPVDKNFPSIEIVANIIQNILEQKFITRPSWAKIFELICIFLCGGFIILVLPRLKAKWGAIISTVLFLLIIFTGVFLFLKNGYWIKILYPSLMLISGYVIITSKHFLITEKRKEQVETESIETNKMLGLSFQGQGMLDIAFEKFRKCPVDDSMKEILYNLGLDFERKRQFNKSIAVYEYIQATDPKYKDIEARIQTLKTASETVIFGAPGVKKGKSDTVIVEGLATQAPTLGRYEIVKELGHGAMGIVYLGKDPKINRMVAIKTLKFEDDVSDQQMKQIKERFFREAEAAGALSHPNIVKIYDAGEDYDISYIAMELLEGEDLKKYCEKENLLPIKKVIEIIMNVCDALNYAHNQGIVHRDIKPANIMILKDNSIRVTDFGIARITATSQTATGTVLGTPSYMSPEQISGKKVDGRSDLFSLGVVLYELLTGEKPFKGDSIATIIFQISNEVPQNPKIYNPDIPESLINVINKALQKNPDNRYQTGKEMYDDLKNVLETIK